MEFIKNKKLIVLLIIIVVLGLFLLGFYIFSNSNDNDTDNANKENTNEEVTYPTISDTEEAILKTVYNENVSVYATGFTTPGGNTENIFGNESETLADNLSQETKMAIALYAIENDVNTLSTISCSDVSWNSSWDDRCGGAGENMAYQIPVSDLNDKVVQIFNKDLDYSALNLDDLTIGTCTDNNNKIYPFRYIEDLGIYVSVIKDNCNLNRRLEVTKLAKTQANDTLTLDVYYTLYQNNKELDKRQDKFYFKIREDGTYYFYSSVMVGKNLQ